MLWSAGDTGQVRIQTSSGQSQVKVTRAKKRDMWCRHPAAEVRAWLQAQWRQVHFSRSVKPRAGGAGRPRVAALHTGAGEYWQSREWGIVMAVLEWHTSVADLGTEHKSK